jgi:hypothetical protein
MPPKETVQRHNGVWHVEERIPGPKGTLMRVRKGEAVEHIIWPENLGLMKSDGTEIKK